MRAEGRHPAENTPLPRLDLPPDAPTGTVAGALAALPGPQLDALLQAYLHGGDPARIAARLDRSEPDIEASLDAALAHIDEAVHA